MEIKKKLEDRTYSHKERVGKTRSKVWTQFHHIIDATSKAVINGFFLCINCLAIVYNSANDGNTMVFLRHSCVVATKMNKTKPLVSKKDKDNLNLAAAKFICKDLRPYLAIECEGLIDLCEAVMKFGQHYQKAN